MSVRWVPLLMLSLWLVGTVAGEASARLYKWVDEQGQVHYSDTVPPQAADQRRKIKTPSGRTIQTIEPPPTREELAAKRRRRAQAERDRRLLLTYSSIQDIKTTRDSRLQAITAQIRLTQSRLNELRVRLHTQQRKAVHIELTGKSDPTPVYTKIKKLKQLIEMNNQFLKRELQKRQRIRQEFARAIERYRELMAAHARKAHQPFDTP